jgi:histidinol phosphatase-like PHP family hydrolase
MKFRLDHDYHIHSYLSLCAADQNQTPKAILDKAKKMGYKKICLTDHFLDADVGFKPCFHPDFEWIKKALPLPKDEKVEFLFGCEAEMTYDGNVAVSSDKFDKFDFILIATTHMHITGGSVSEEQTATNLDRAKTWVWFLDRLFSMDMPFHKIGLPHLACTLINNKSRKDYLETLDLISSEDMERLFTRAAVLGVGIELNYCDFIFTAEEQERILRMFRIAKNCGCKFYYGSDEHVYGSRKNEKEFMENVVDLLGLTEDDKFIIKK